MKKKKRFGDARDSMEKPPCTMPARQRAGKEYMGGRPLRRAMARLKSRQSGVQGTPERKMPGAMKH
jgi:hypothetical protein